MERLYDLALGSNGKVKVWNRGFFEHTNEMSLAPMPELIEAGIYRFSKKEYEANKAVFDKFFKRENITL